MNLVKYKKDISAKTIRVGEIVRIKSSDRLISDLSANKLLKVVDREYCSNASCQNCTTNHICLRLWPIEQEPPDDDVGYACCDLILETLNGRRIM